MKKCSLLLLFLCFSTLIKSQTIRYREQYLVLNISQIREKMNYGFVFSGLQLQYGRNWQWSRKSTQYELGTQLGIALLSEKGQGYDFHLSPVHFDYLVNVYHWMWIGPSLLSDYNYEFYPDLQAGHDFWFTHFSTGISFGFEKAFPKRVLSVKCKCALFGFTSRTPDDFDALFFYVGFKYAVQNLHKNMQFHTINQYQIVHLEAAFKPLKARRFDLSYLMDYMNYSSNPSWTRLNFGLKLTMHAKNGRS
jgi:hypothetical protein